MASARAEATGRTETNTLSWAFMEAVHYAAIWSPEIKGYCQRKQSKTHVMKNKKKKFIAFSIVLIAVVWYFGYDYAPWNQKQHAIETTLYWCQLNALPESARDLEVQIKGSAFAREFIITFSADNTVTEEWLNSSPGIKTRIKLPDSGNLVVKPSLKDAQFGEIRINIDTNTVNIRTYWS